MSGFIARPDPILVGLSGGVDSAVCVRILQELGFAVEGLVIDFSPAHEASVEAAQLAARELEIPLSVAKPRALFRQEVVTPFCEAYAGGFTPNPCVVCNPLVKFRTLCEEADRRGIHFVASGHYARIEERDGVYHVAQAQSLARDQSYMLYRLPQEVLRRLCLPVGEFAKEDIREMAREYGLSAAEAPDSQEICFIPDGNYPAYIEAQGVQGKPGRFIGPNGEDLGPHKGILHYTVGQRRGTGLALGKPVFVKSIEANGDIHIGFAGDEYAASILLADLVFAGESPCQGRTLQVKIRSAAKPVPCVVGKVEGGSLRVDFDEPQRAPAPGQSAVLYDGPLVLGGGIIQKEA